MIILGHRQVKWIPDEGMAKGELKFVLAGERLMGKFTWSRSQATRRRARQSLALVQIEDAFAGKGRSVARNVTSVISGRTMKMCARAARTCE